MILLDYRQIANVVFFSGFDQNGYDEDKFKNYFINYALHFKKRFLEYGEYVICLDSKDYWRKSIFPYYKASRKKSREESDIDYKKVYELFDAMVNDIQEHLPWKLVSAKRAEADDCIGVLATRFHQKEKIVIVSGDKDFLQLQKYPNIVQYSPLEKKMLIEANPEIALREKIIRGDKGDGVPNCRTKDDIFVADGRSKSIMKTWLEPILKSPSFDHMLTEEEAKYYNRNKNLIDLSCIPKDISDEIISNYSNYVPNKKSKIFPYLSNNNYSNLIDRLGEF